MRYTHAQTLRDGAKLVLRSMENADAGAAIFALRRVAGETDFLLSEPEECGATLEQEENFIETMNSRPREALIGAFLDGELVGMANIAQVSRRRRACHRATVGVSVLRDHWGKGIGTALMLACMELARAVGYEQMELEVVENNARAVALYQKLGFVCAGQIPRAIRYRDGRYANLTVMVRTL